MKYSLLLISLAVIFSNCKEETAEVEAVSIVGSWKLDSQTWEKCTSSDDNFKESNLCTASTCFTYAFTVDGLFTYEIKISNIIDTKTGTYSISGDQLTICITGCSIPVTFTRSGNTLTLTYLDSTTGCSVTRIYKS
jgi:hypothetical protein